MKKYVLTENVPDGVKKVFKHYPEFVGEMLFRRGIKTAKDADSFLNPDYASGIHDPFLIKDMDKAVARILEALEKKEKIAIWSDYDADGIPGAVVMYDFFQKIKYDNFVNYIPHRHDEGFGLNEEGIKELAENGVNLVITIDCGITDVSEVELANKLGMEVIVTDHHLPGKVLPKAFAILDSKQAGDEYPFKELCGSGVIFKFIQAILQKNNFGLKVGTEKWFLDMVGLATLSDMVPLVDENRIFAVFGLKVLRKSQRIGLLKLFKKLKLDQKNITEDDIGFTITPRINAASRMGVPMDAFKLLSTSDANEAEKFAEHLDKINNERKGIVASMVKEARKKIVSRGGQDGMDKVIVLGNPDWKPSLLGLVANSLVGDHSRPVFLWGRVGNEIIKGSCRSSGEVSVVEVMSYAKEVFIDFGGHKMSGGFSVSIDKVHLLENALVKGYELAVNSFKDGDGDIVLDKKLNLDDVSWETYKEIEKFAPFGTGNSKPLFLFEKVSPVNVKVFGKENNHLELTFKSLKGKKIVAIAFFSTPTSFGGDIKVGIPIDLIATLEKSNFRNFPELRLRIVDVLN